LYFNYNIVTDEDWLRDYNEKYHNRKKWRKIIFLFNFN
jgi:hypothetical protein